MHFAVIDCGTTNSRMYILNEQFKIISKGYKKIGVRDTAINGSNKILKIGLKELFESTLNSAGLKISEVKFAITFGMITSEIGLIEIPHLFKLKFSVINKVINTTVEEFTNWTSVGDAAVPANNSAEWTDIPNNTQGGTLGYWTAPNDALTELKYNLWGSGRNLSIGFSTDILGSQVSIQEVNIQALQGRIL